MNRAIWVVAEAEEEGFNEATLEILGEAKELGNQLGCEVASVLMGHNITRPIDELFHYGAAKVYLIEHELLASYTTEGYTKALVDLIQQFSPQIVLFGGTRNGLDLAPRVAARLRVGIVTNCTIIRKRGGILELVQPIYEDRVYRTLVSQSAELIIAAMRPGVIGRDKPDRSRGGEVIRLRPELDPGEIRVKVLESFKTDPKTLDIEEVEILVVGGRGVESGQWTLIEELAEVLGGGVGGTRMAMDAGWITMDKLIGQTGKTVSPKLCIEAGVSGAIQHTAGLKDAHFILAINKDRYAPIFKVGNVGVVADLSHFLPILISKIRELSPPKEGNNR